MGKIHMSSLRHTVASSAGLEMGWSLSRLLESVTFSGSAASAELRGGTLSIVNGTAMTRRKTNGGASLIKMVL